MSEATKKASAPYATYGSFIKFINDLSETGVPPRIDNTVFKSTSGSTIYSVMPALKFLKLIDAEGVPSDSLKLLAAADETERAGLLKEIVQGNYKFFFQPDCDASVISAGQFNEKIREEYDVPASTIDKIANFFIAACKDAGIELSTHLLNRKPLAASSSSKRSKKQRAEPPAEDKTNGKAPPPPPVISEKALEYRLVDLMSEAVSEPEVMQAIVQIITFLKTKDAAISRNGNDKENV